MLKLNINYFLFIYISEATVLYLLECKTTVI